MPRCVDLLHLTSIRCDCCAQGVTGFALLQQMVQVRSEFHSRQGIDMSRMPRMEPDQIVAASLADLGRGIVVCIPAMPDDSAKTRLDDAAAALLAVARSSELPARYA